MATTGFSSLAPANQERGRGRGLEDGGSRGDTPTNAKVLGTHTQTHDRSQHNDVQRALITLLITPLLKIEFH